MSDDFVFCIMMPMTSNLQNSIILLTIGAMLTLLGSVVTLVGNYIALKLRANEDRKENFKIKLAELKLQAAQKAYQYIFKIHRASRRSQLSQNIADEARDWLDGQAIILGDEIYTAVFTYFNNVLTNNTPFQQAKAMDQATIKLKSVLKNPLVV